MFCAKCGKNNPNNVNFCIFCGEQLEKNQPTADISNQLDYSSQDNNSTMSDDYQTDNSNKTPKKNHMLLIMGIISATIILVLTGIIVILFTMNMTHNTIPVHKNETENITEEEKTTEDINVDVPGIEEPELTEALQELIDIDPITYFKAHPDMKYETYLYVSRLPTNNYLYVRDTYSKNGKIIGKLYNGNQVYVYGVYNSWAYIYYYKTGYGWCYTKYLDINPVENNSSSLINSYYRVKNVGSKGLYLRTGNSKDYPPKTLMYENYLVYVYNIDEYGWAYVKDMTSGYKGWCFSKYLQYAYSN